MPTLKSLMKREQRERERKRNQEMDGWRVIEGKTKPPFRPSEIVEDKGSLEEYQKNELIYTLEEISDRLERVENSLTDIKDFIGISKPKRKKKTKKKVKRNA